VKESETVVDPLGVKLLKAAAVGDLAEVDAALLQGADVNTAYDADVMGVILEADPDIAHSQLRLNCTNDPEYVFTVSDWVALPLGATALILASRGGHEQVLQRLLAEPGIDCNKGTKEAINTGRNRQTALHWACRLGIHPVVKVLISDDRVDVNCAMLTGFTPLAVAIQQGHLKVVNELLACPRTSFGIQFFAEEEEAKAYDEQHGLRLKTFGELGADVEAMNSSDCMVGMVLLFHAAGENRLDVMRRCLEVEGIRKFFFDPTVQAILPECFRGCSTALGCEHSPEVLRFWLETGLSPNDLTMDGSTMLDFAIKFRMVEHIRVLLMNKADSTELSPLQRAQLLGDAPAVKGLVLSGARCPMSELLSTSDEEIELYLPREVGGVQVLVGEGEYRVPGLDGLRYAQWRADDSKLNADAHPGCTSGIAYRTSMTLDAKCEQLVNFGEAVRGEDMGEGWVKVTVNKAIALGSDSVPALHRAALQGDDSAALVQVKKELSALSSRPEAARELLGDGKLPAAFYAVEVGHFKVAQLLFERAYGFKAALVKKLMAACKKIGKDAAQGERSFQVCLTLIKERVLEDDAAREAALAFLKPWCSSLIAVRYCDHWKGTEPGTMPPFQELKELCKQRIDAYYKRVDEKVTAAVLQQAGQIGDGVPYGHIRQDAPGLVPALKAYRDYAQRTPMSFDHEAMVAHAYALLGEGLCACFESDIRKVFQGASTKVVTAPPKSFQRMQNKLLNPSEHGDPAAQRPRCAKNVDVLRGCVVVKSVTELEAAYEKLAATFKVVRVKNTYGTSGTVGYRCLLVNFIYQPRLVWSQVFGDKVTFDFADWSGLFTKIPSRLEHDQTELGTMWLNYVQRSCSMTREFALQALQVVASESPDEPVRMVAELQLVLEPYYEGRKVSHFQYKVARCDTGPMEMVRDFSQECFLKEVRCDEILRALQQDARKKSK
jgi:ankyrin repeat protein